MSATLSPSSPAVLDGEGECPLEDVTDWLFPVATGDDSPGVSAVDLFVSNQHDDIGHVAFKPLSSSMTV